MPLRLQPLLTAGRLSSPKVRAPSFSSYGRPAFFPAPGQTAPALILPRARHVLFHMKPMSRCRVFLLALLAAAAGCGKAPPPPAANAPLPAPRPADPPPLSFRFHHLDAGRVRRITILLAAPGSLEAYTLADDQGRRHRGTRTDPRPLFLRDVQRNPAAAALSFIVPADVRSLDLVAPDGRTSPVARLADPPRLHPAARPVPCEGWEILPSGSPGADEKTFELEVQTRPLEPQPEPLAPESFVLLSDDGNAFPPHVLHARPPFKLRYSDVPPSARRLRLQISFRSERPEYVVFGRPLPEPRAQPPADPTPLAAPSLPPDFDARLAADPVAALRSLNPDAGLEPELHRRVRRIAAQTLRADLEAGFRAFASKDPTGAERPLARAALLAESDAPELSRQLVRLLLLLPGPRRVPTDCSSCAGQGCVPCASCRDGRALGPCPRCEAKGHTPCLLCDAAGTLDHPGFRGTLILSLQDRRIRTEAGTGTLHGQIITYHMGLCSGGRFPLRTENVITCPHKNDPRVKPVKFEGSIPCAEFWNQMRLYAFNGRAQIQIVDPRGRPQAVSSPAARRFMADYETCKGGRIPCERCAGRRLDPCSVCSGQGRSALPCPACEGTARRACTACKGYGDASWLARLLGPADPPFRETLQRQARTLRDWIDARARRTALREDLARRLEEARRGLDPAARLTDDYVDLPCPRCKGAGGDCEECWASGRREYYEGTPPYERYALARRLERRLQEAALPEAPPELVAWPHTPGLPAADPAGPSPRSSPPAVAIPATVEEIVQKADLLHETGKAHLEKAKSAADPALWGEEASRALQDLRQAQTLYAAAQEKLDAEGRPIPRELRDKFRTNMQALIMARRAAP